MPMSVWLSGHYLNVAQEKLFWGNGQWIDDYVWATGEPTKSEVPSGTVLKEDLMLYDVVVGQTSFRPLCESSK